MKNMQFLLKLLGGTVITTGAAVSVVACNNQVATTPDISNNVQIDDVPLQADASKTYYDLNNNITLTSAVAQAINTAFNIATVAGIDFSITNDQVQDANQAVGAIVKFTVNAMGDQIKGHYEFIETLSKPDISVGVTISDPQTTADLSANYSSLNNNPVITDLVASAINKAKNVTVSSGTDFVIKNDQNGSDLQTLGKVVTFTVTGTGPKITGKFTFTDTLGKADISSGVVIPDLQTGATLGAKFSDLNTDQNVLTAVVNAINTAKSTSITASDITLTNDQSGLQVAGAPVLFTVSANSSQITGSFTFTDTLGKPDISTGVSIPMFTHSANPTYNYGQLNSMQSILNRVVLAINTAKNTSINYSDFVLTNDQPASANVVPGQLVTFTVTSKSDQIQGSFTFTATLGTVSIASGVTIADPQTAAASNTSYTALNTNTALTSAVASAINSAKGTTVTASDFTLTNNKTGNQVAGAPVAITVTANASSTQINGSFTFIDTLTKANISSGVTVTDPRTPFVATTYGALNNNANLTTAVANAINNAKGTNVTASDFTLTNDQTATNTIVAGQVVTITVTANANSNQITGSFTFTDTIGKVSLTGIVLSDPLTSVDTSATYAALNTNVYLQNAISNAIFNAKNVSAVAGTDYTITNNQTATANQVAGTAVTFTVTGISNKLGDSFTFTDTLTKANISSGVYVQDPATPFNAVATYGALNTYQPILNAVANAISAYKKVYVSATSGVDFVLTNNQTATATPIRDTTVTFTVNAVSTSTRLAANSSFNFFDFIRG